MIKEGICLATVIVNLTGTWNKQDQETLERAQKRCAQIFPSSPCLKKLIKKEWDTYNAICGEKHPEYLSWISDQK